MKLIVNADDFGYSLGVNAGIIKAHKDGILTSTTAMVTMPGIKDAVRLSKLYPNLKIGLHLNITLGKPLSECESIVKEDGCFYKPKESPDYRNFKKEDIKKEFLAQYELFVKLFNKRPTHLDSHLYAHQIYDIVKLASRELAEEKNIPLRDVETNHFMRVPFLNWFKVSNDEDAKDLWKKFVGHKDNMLQNDIAELMVHPALPDSYLFETSSYNRQRLFELEVLTDIKMKEFIARNKIELTSFEEEFLCLK